MRLKTCFEYALVCGLETVGEAYENIRLHAPQIARYEDIQAMLEELAGEIEDGELTPSMRIMDVIEKLGWETYYKSEEDRRYDAPSIRRKE